MSATQVFVLGTGRCGTQTLAEFLSGLEGCNVVHESEPFLLEEVTEYLAGRTTREQMVELLRRTRSVETIGGQRLSGESNQRLSFVLPELAEAFPNAKYVWVIRDGRENVVSMHHRQWYHPREADVRHPVVRPWAINRMRGDDSGDMSASEWSQLDAFGRCCWYWSYTNRVIEKQAKELNLDLMYLRLEDVQSRVGEMMKFLGIEVAGDLKVPRSNKGSGSRRPIPWRQWSRRQREVFARVAGPLMDRHYSGWRDPMQFTIGQELNGFWNRSLSAVYASCADATRPLRNMMGKTQADEAPRRQAS